MTALEPLSAIDRAVTAALAGLAPESKRAYRRRMTAYLAWLKATGGAMTRESVSVYIDRLSKGEQHNGI